MLTTDYMAQVLNVINRISQGYTLTDACDKERISFSTFRHYVNGVPELAAMYTDAEQRGYDVMADALLDPFGHLQYGTTDSKKAKIMSDNIKWYLARKRPTLYGDKSIVEHQFTADKTIVEALQRGKDAVAKSLVDNVAYTVIEETQRAITYELPDELKQFA